ncbi:peptide chain release factor 2 [bacterium]|jgi:peptide chain release factor 2|nr:peptide chain release factor 2 [bacterium]MBT3903376.1 peptide chain release factor 2 [bacterium]MBT4577681.1 peptide chain release factor 2 [bacterium]MBT5345843.1 peptide chain release factor 2 [bacterium]MBT6130822.1 peptide chain release factor 2 [bacterium]
MLIDDLREQLKDFDSDVQTIVSYWTKSDLAKRFEELEGISSKEDFWQHPDQTKITKELRGIRSVKEQYEHITSTFEQLPELLDLFEDDEQELQKISPEIAELAQTIRRFKIQLLMGLEQDKHPCFVLINAGAGGTESQDWAQMLLRMYTRFCETHRLKAAVVDVQSGEEAGIKSATLHVTGKNAYGLLKSEHGIHRLVRISPYDSNKRRHTSFSGVTLTPEMPDVNIEIDPKDLRIDTYRASGAGGQHINKTDSAVRITHLPTNIVVQCQNDRSQIKNRETAMKMLMAKLVQRQDEERKKALGKIDKKKIEWGSQIRSYVLHPYKMVKDHRTNVESSQPDMVLDGQLMPFIEGYLVWQASQA